MKQMSLTTDERSTDMVLVDTAIDEGRPLHYRVARIVALSRPHTDTDNITAVDDRIAAIVVCLASRLASLFVQLRGRMSFDVLNDSLHPTMYARVLIRRSRLPGVDSRLRERYVHHHLIGDCLEYLKTITWDRATFAKTASTSDSFTLSDMYDMLHSVPIDLNVLRAQNNAGTRIPDVKLIVQHVLMTLKMGLQPLKVAGNEPVADQTQHTHTPISLSEDQVTIVLAGRRLANAIGSDVMSYSHNLNTMIDSPTFRYRTIVTNQLFTTLPVVYRTSTSINNVIDKIDRYVTYGAADGAVVPGRDIVRLVT
jgi:hypothetical protein